MDAGFGELVPFTAGRYSGWTATFGHLQAATQGQREVTANRVLESFGWLPGDNLQAFRYGGVYHLDAAVVDEKVVEWVPNGLNGHVRRQGKTQRVW